MKNRIFYIPLMLIVALMAGCTKDEIKLSFELPAEVNGAYQVVYYAATAEMETYRETAVDITSGKGEIVLPEKVPTLVFLLQPSQREPITVIYAKRGEKFEIKGDGTDVDAWTIRGNDVTEALTAWRRENLELLKRNERKKLNAAVSEYVKKNPNSDAAAIILTLFYDRSDDEAQFLKLYDSLDRSVRENAELRRALATAALVTGNDMAPKAKLPARIVLTGQDGYADTLSQKKGETMLLIFRSGNEAPGHALDLDSLKRILGRKKNAVAAELYANYDSLAWTRAVKRDTIPGLRRLWLPLGLSDSLAMQAGVRRLPYFIVTDGGRKEVYRGGDAAQAWTKFDSISK